MVAYKGEKRGNYIEHQNLRNMNALMDKHEKTLKQRSLRKKVYSELHSLLDQYILFYHQEFCGVEGSLEYKGWMKKLSIFIQTGGRRFRSTIKKNLITMRKTEV